MDAGVINRKWRGIAFQKKESVMEKDIFEDKGYITYLVISNLIFWGFAIWLVVTCFLMREG